MSDHAATLESLRAQHEALAVRAEIASLERTLRADALTDSLVLNESVHGDLVDRHEYRNDTAGWDRPSSRTAWRDDRRDGRYLPFFETEADLQDAWGIARFLAGSEEIGCNAVETLTNYTIGTGFTYTAKPRKSREKSSDATNLAQLVIDEFIEANQWEGDLERELFGLHGVVDGEWGLWIQDAGGGRARARVVDPECITEPADPRRVEDYCALPAYCWSFGVASDHGDSSRQHGYFVQWYGDASDWEFVPAAEMVLCRHNVPRSVKRGMTDFWPVWRKIEKASKLIGNTLEGGAIQAAIAFIREHAAGTTGSQITAFRTGGADASTTIQRPIGTTKTVYQRKFSPGTILDVSAGLQYKAGPMGQSNGPIYVDIAQAAMRLVGARWSMPEYMISGDASNANYSSTLVAGSPFVKATEARQSFYVRQFSRVFWRVLDIAVRHGRFASIGVRSLVELKQAMRLDITAPAVAIGDDLKQEHIRDSQQKAGILSPRTRAELSDLDYDNELQNGAKAAEVPQFGAQGTGQGQLPAPVMESHVHLHECGGEGGKPGPCPSGGRKKKARKSIPTLTEKNAIQDYTSDKFKVINGQLRSGASLDGDTGRIVASIDSYMGKAEKFKGSTFRQFEASDDLIAQLQPGKVFSDAAFMSTSKDKPQFIPKGRIAVQIVGSNGVDISGISHHGAAEKEVLYPRNSKFEVVHARQHEHGGWVAHLRQLESVRRPDFITDGDSLLESMSSRLVCSRGPLTESFWRGYP